MKLTEAQKLEKLREAYYDQKMDVVRMTVPLRQVTESLEAFSMAFQKSNTGIDFHFGWGNYRGTLPFSK